jgi:large subunit ribosomal protein L25
VGENALAAEIRSGTGKGAARKLRAQGSIPAVVYGKAKEGRPIMVSARDLQRLLLKSTAGINTLIDLQIDDGEEVVIVKELQREPVGGDYLHADFYTVDLTQKIEVSVPLHFVGKAPGVDLGGILDHPLREIELRCLPRAIPESIDVDVSTLEIGQSIHVRELQLPANVEVVSDPELAVAAVATPRAEEEPSVEEAPEVEVAAGAAEGDAADAEKPAEE